MNKKVIITNSGLTHSCSDTLQAPNADCKPKPQGPKMPDKIKKIQVCTLKPGDACTGEPHKTKVGNECWEYCCEPGYKKALVEFAKEANRIKNRGTNNKPKKKKRK